MAIDSSLFHVTIPSGTHAAGEVLPLGCIRGPSVVRDGYGAAKLKRIYTIGNTTAQWKIIVKNANWVDSMQNLVPTISGFTLARNSSGLQEGNDCELQPNSGWIVTAECVIGASGTTAEDLFAMIDIDYPQVQGVADPKTMTGTPVSEISKFAYTTTEVGASNLVWTTYNIDSLKAGSKYLLAEAGFKDVFASIGFMSISGSSNQHGLERIIPCIPPTVNGLRYLLDYSTPLVKGPMNINLAAVTASGQSAGLQNAYLELDWVKKAL